MKKLLVVAALLLGTVSFVNAQTNIQEMYDYQRGHFTTTLEMFQADDWGSTFFFTDIYHPSAKTGPTDFYTEIARSLNFWHNSNLAPLSLHVEWNGGMGEGYLVNNAWLFGVEYFLHNSDFSNTFTFELMYKAIEGQTANTPLQFTFVWGMQNIFGVRGLNFSGFFDAWGENLDWAVADKNELLGYRVETTKLVILSEPQIWYNVGQHFGCPNLSVGGEVELAYNFTGGHKAPDFIGPFSTVYSNRNKGFTWAPCVGIKWVFNPAK